MIKRMIKSLVLSFSLMIAPVMCYSSTTSIPKNQDSIPSYQVSIEDIKYSNLIFAEHAKLLKENPLLYEQIQNYQRANELLIKTDSINKVNILELRKINNAYSNKISNLDEQIRKEKETLRYWRIGGVTVSVALLMMFLFVK